MKSNRELRKEVLWNKMVMESAHLQKNYTFKTPPLVSPTKKEQTPEERRLPAGIESLKKLNNLRQFKERNVNIFMSKKEVQDQILFRFNDGRFPHHPLLRTMVSIESDAFKEAYKLVAKEIKKAKKNNYLVSHLLCCNMFYIGHSPRVTNHVVNDELRGILDARNLSKTWYNPNYLPFSEEVSTCEYEIPDTLSMASCDECSCKANPSIATTASEVDPKEIHFEMGENLSIEAAFVDSDDESEAGYLG